MLGSVNYNMTSLVLQVSDAISHAVDAPAEPKKAPEWRQLHEKYAKEMLPLKASHCLWHAGRAAPAYSHCVCCKRPFAAITMTRKKLHLLFITFSEVTFVQGGIQKQ